MKLHQQTSWDSAMVGLTKLATPTTLPLLSRVPVLLLRRQPMEIRVEVVIKCPENN